MKNQYWRPFLLTLLVVGALIGLFYLPRITIGDTLLRRVNILSDIQFKDSLGRTLVEVAEDSTEGIVEEVFDEKKTLVEGDVYVDTVPTGMTGIEDFVLNGRPNMDHFYNALASSGSQLVRVAYFGDSFIEADIITSELRNLLQNAYGGHGVGFVDINALTAKGRPTVKATADGWTTHRVNDAASKGFKASLQGINGQYFIPGNSATFTAKMQDAPAWYGARLGTAERATIYYTPGSGLQLYAAINGGEEQLLTAESGVASVTETTREVREPKITKHMSEDSVWTYDTTWVTRTETITNGTQEQGHVSSKSLSGDIRTFRLTAKQGGSSRFYGVAFDGNTGVTLDNMSMRSAPGSHLAGIPQQTLNEFAALRPYDLIIIQFGLNVASPKRKDYSDYTAKMGTAIQHFRQAFPQASILVVSVADRDKRIGDGMHTMGGIRELVAFQRKMAAEQHVAFWNMYEAMGADGSIARMVANGEAAKDFTHMNFQGGKVLAKMFFDVLKNGKENYGRR